MITNKKQRILFFIIFLLSIMMAIGNTAMPLLLKGIIDGLSEKNEIWKNKGIIFLLVICFILIVELLRKVLTAKYQCSLLHWFRMGLCENILNRNIQKIRENSPQEYISIINNEITTVVEDYYLELNDVLFQIAGILAGCITLSSIYLPLSVISIVSSVIIVIIPVLFKKVLGELKANRMESLRKYNVSLKDMFFGYNEIRIRNLISSIKVLVGEKSSDFISQEYRYCRANALSQIIIGSVSFANLLLIIYIGGQNVANNQMSIGSLIAAIQLSELLTQPIIGISYSLNTVLSTLKIKNNMKPFYEKYDTEIKSRIEEIEVIEFRNVTIVRDGRVIIKDFSHSFTKGKKYLILGKNGSGKSSLIDLLIYPELLTEIQGQVMINGIDRSEIDDSCIYALVSFITQKSYLFSASIQDNINCFTDNPIYIPDALKKSKNDFVFDVIDDRLLENENEKISGGEKQKIALLRALQGSHEWLILDESTSAMDKESRVMTEQFLLTEKRKTIIQISHIIDKEEQEKYDEVICL